MLSRHLPILLAPLLATALTACGDNTSDKKDAANIADATSPKAVEALKKNITTNSLPKADTSTPTANYVELNSGNQIMFSYLALASMPIDYPQIASLYSKEYKSASDEFRKNDLLNALKPKIDAEIENARTHPYMKLSIDNPIEKYDFEQQAFPIKNGIWESGSYRYFYDNSTYKVGFNNGTNFRYLKPANEEEARRIEELRSKYSGMSLVIYGYAQNTDISENKLQLQIVKIRLEDRKGNTLALQ